MKNIKIALLALATISLAFISCDKDPEDLGLRSDPSVYTTMTPTPLDAATVSTSASGNQSIPQTSFRTYVNELQPNDVKIKFRFTGTGVINTHYKYVGDSTVIVPANTRYKDVPVEVVVGSVGTGANRTVIFNLQWAVDMVTGDSLNVGIGTNDGYYRSTYTITK